MIPEPGKLNPPPISARASTASTATGRALSPRQGLQFSLRSLLVAVAVVSGLLAVYSHLGIYPALVASLVLVLVGAHVVGNALGTKLRDQPVSFKGTDDDRLPGTTPADQVQLARSVPPSLLRDQAPAWTGRAMVLLWIGFVGGGGAMLWFVLPQWESYSLGGIAIMTFSAAILGGLAGFLVNRFVTSWFRAFRQARQFKH